MVLERSEPRGEKRTKAFTYLYIVVYIIGNLWVSNHLHVWLWFKIWDKYLLVGKIKGNCVWQWSRKGRCWTRQRRKDNELNITLAELAWRGARPPHWQSIFFSAFHSVFPPFRSSFFPSCSVLKLHDTSFYIYLFTPGCPGSSLLHTGYLVGANGSYCLAVVHRLLIVVLPVVGGASALEGGFGLCGTWAQLPHGMWNLPGPGI